MGVLRYIRTTPVCGDCTAGYDVETDRSHRGYTVKELIDIVLKEQPGEWGKIMVRLVERNGAFVKNIFIANYDHGEISYNDEGFEAYKNRRVHNITSHGGWGAMDYMFFVYMKETE